MTEYRLFEFDVPAGVSIDIDDGEPIFEERWLACQHPERPPDDKCAYHFDCHGCLLVVQTLAASGLWPETSIEIEKALAYCGPGGGDFWEQKRAS